MLQALNTGHEGSLVTVHANNADDALYRLETLATMSDLHVPHDALREYINNAIHVIVQIERGADGGRRLVEVAVVASSRGEPFQLQTAMRFEADPVGPDLRVTGRPCHFALPERISHALMLAGVEVPPAFALRRGSGRADPGGRVTTLAAISRVTAAELCSAVVGLLALRGLWLLVSSSARRSELMRARRGRHSSPPAAR